MTMTARDLSELLRRSAASAPGSSFVFPDDRYTFPEMDRRCDEFAAMYRSAGLGAGDHVGLWMPASLDMIAAIVACARIGAVAVPLNDRFRTDELHYVVTHGDLTALVTSAPDGHTDRPAELMRALPGLAAAPAPMLALHATPRLRRVIVVGATGYPPPCPGITSQHELGLPATHPGDRMHQPPVDADDSHGDIAYLMYTSGTSASPKACIISAAAVVAQGGALADSRYLLDSTSVFWCPLPLFHTAGLATLAACITAGASFVHAGVFDPAQSLRAMERERVTHAIPCFETIWMRVLDHPDFATTDLSSLRVLMNTGGEDLLRKLQARVPHAVQLANYGITEGSGHVAMTEIADSLDVRVRTGGFLLPGMQARIVDLETGHTVAPNVEGEIHFRGESRFLGYYRDPEANATYIDADGWFASGDLGVLDEDGRLTYKGRVKDMLKVGGENVASLEIESYLLRHPDIAVVAVVAAPDAYYGEVPAAFVQLADGRRLDEADVIDFCLDRIATYKVPRYVRFVTQWPMSGTKIRKVELRQHIADELAAQNITEAPRLRSSRAARVAP
ncbi:acyl--CoA ligase [Mycolicibacterium murale]|nr:acyl--CoA ligase [Mycolicibacterium murale]